MAINIGATTTWQVMMTNIRRKTGTESDQESGLIDAQLRGFIYSAMLEVKREAGKLLDAFYTKKEPVTLSAISSGVSTGSLAATSTTFNIESLDPKRISLTASLTSTFVSIPVLDIVLYNQYKKSWSTTSIGTTGAIGSVYLAAGTPDTLTVEIYTGATGTPATPFLFYPKNPEVWVADSDTVDMPDHFCPIVEDRVVKMIMGRSEITKQLPNEQA
jgi:hypothetical protein